MTKNICYNDVIYGFNWMKYITRMIFAIPLAIIAFNILAFSPLTPDVTQWTTLNYANPNPVAMFLSNDMHTGWSHMMNNILSYVITVGCIAGMALYAMPYANKKIPDMACRFGTKTLVQSTLVFFLIAPFIISAVSIVVGNVEGVSGGLGFSGIEYAFEGYLIYLLMIIVIRKMQVLAQKSEKPWLVRMGFIIVFILPALLLASPVYDMIFNPSGGINYAAHITGFVIGIMTPWVLENLRDRKFYISVKSSSISEES